MGEIDALLAEVERLNREATADWRESTDTAQIAHGVLASPPGVVIGQEVDRRLVLTYRSAAPRLAAEVRRLRGLLPQEPEFKPLHLRKCSNCGTGVFRGPWLPDANGEHVRELRYGCTCDGSPPLPDGFEPVVAPSSDRACWDEAYRLATAAWDLLPRVVDGVTDPCPAVSSEIACLRMEIVYRNSPAAMSHVLAATEAAKAADLCWKQGGDGVTPTPLFRALADAEQKIRALSEDA